jgi:hypothetical protein
MKSPAEALKRLLAVLDLLEIPYMVAGSTASSLYGISRPTMDIDLVADLRPDQIDDFAKQLGSEFYADPETMREAISRGRAFNLIHFGSTYKFDIFPLQADEYSRTQFARRQFAETVSFGEPIECAFGTAEDTILAKLRWYRAGREASERQWQDLLGILRISGASLDRQYLNTWAPRLGIADLLAALLSQATIDNH